MTKLKVQIKLKAQITNDRIFSFKFYDLDLFLIWILIFVIYMINIPSTIKIALRALRVNKMRSALTMLGIIIGVGAVIAMLAVGAGASQKIEEQISSMGSNLLMILPGDRKSTR